MNREDMVTHCMKGGSLLVDASKSGFLFKRGLYSRKAVRAQLLLRSLAFAFLIIGALVFIFFKWYVGTSLIFLMLLAGRAAHKHAALTTFIEALSDDEIFQMADQLNLIRTGGAGKKSSEYAFGKGDLPLKATFEYARNNSPIVCEPTKTASGKIMRVYRRRVKS